MAGESWKSHKNSALQRDMDADHEAQRREYEPRIVSTQEVVQEIRDGYAQDVNPAAARIRQEAMADWARNTAQTIDLDQPVEVDSVERLRARIDDLYEQEIPALEGVDWVRSAPGRSPWDKPPRAFSETPGGLTPFERERMDRQAVENNRELAEDLARDREADPILSERIAHQAVTYVPPTPEQQYQPATDYPRAVLANTRVVPAATVDPRAPRPAAETVRFQTELAIALQVAGNQARAQQQADAEAGDRVASAAIGQYIAPPRNTPARTPHR